MSVYNNILALAQKSAKDYRGGITSLAMTMEKSPIVLANKLNPNNDNHILSLIEFAEIIELTQDTKTLNALAALISYTTVPLPEAQNITTGELLERFVATNKQCALLGEQIIQARDPQSEAGQQISKKELAVILSEADKLTQLTLSLKYLAMEG